MKIPEKCPDIDTVINSGIVNIRGCDQIRKGVQ